MAAAATYLIKSATFKGTAVDGLEDVQFSDEGDEVLHNHDGSITATACFLDNLRGGCTISCRNQSLFGTANFAEGANGALVIVMQKRAAGKGAVAGQDKTLTAADATLIGKSGNAPHSDRGTLSLEFRCVDPAGSAVWAVT
jgi:hypothetical protein